MWADCGYNMLSNPLGDTIYIAREVYDFEGTLLEPADDLPSYGGVPQVCFDDIYQVPHVPVQAFDFVHGSITFSCSSALCPPGDLNLNEVAHEIADLVLYSNYFVYGYDAFTKDVDCQVKASDVNGDGVTLTVEDMVYMLHIIIGDAIPFPTTPAMPGT